VGKACPEPFDGAQESPDEGLSVPTRTTRRVAQALFLCDQTPHRVGTAYGPCSGSNKGLAQQSRR